MVAKMKKLLTGSAFNLAAATLNKFFVVFVSFYGALVMSEQDHGAVSIFLFLISAISGVLVQALTVSANQFVAAHKDRGEIVRAGLQVLLMATLALWVTGGFITLGFHEETNQLLTGGIANRIELILIFAITPFSSAAGLMTGYLQGIERFKHLALSNFLSVLVVFPGSIYLVDSLSVTGALWSLFLHAIVNCSILLFFCVKSKVPIGNRLEGNKEVKELCARVFLPLLLTNILVAPAYWLGIRVLSVSDGGLSEVSKFTLVWQLGMVLTHIIISLGGAIIPRLVADSRESIYVHQNILNYLVPMGVAFAFLVPFMISAPYLEALAKNRFSADMVTLIVLVSGILYLNAFSSGISRAMTLNKRNWISLCSNGFWLLVLVVMLKLCEVTSAMDLALILLISSLVKTILFFPLFVRFEVLGMKVIKNPLVIVMATGFISISLFVYFGVNSVIVALYSLLVCVAMACSRFLAWGK